MMRTNVLNEQTLNSKSGIGPVHIQPGLGFGYDFAVMSDPVCAEEPARQGLVLVVGHRRHLVLDRPGERHRVRRDDPAPRRRAGRGEPRRIPRARSTNRSSIRRNKRDTSRGSPAGWPAARNVVERWRGRVRTAARPRAYDVFVYVSVRVVDWPPDSRSRTAVSVVSLKVSTSRPQFIPCL